MAKSKGFYGLRRGSTKSMTYSILKGQQITKDRVEGGANPRTYSQMIQRMLFANAVKFYKHAKAGFFKFAFEDKKTVESDYNAFMRHNALKAVAVGRTEYNQDAFPALGNFVLTMGSLTSPTFQYDADNSAIEFDIASSTKVTTVGHLSERILAQYPSLQPGDIVTIVLVVTSLNQDSELEGTAAPTWNIRQFVLDVNDSRTCWDTLHIRLQTGNDPALIYGGNGENVGEEFAIGFSIVFSRNTPNGLKVSNSIMKGNGLALDYISQYSTEGAINMCASTWGATDPAILAGALAK